MHHANEFDAFEHRLTLPESRAELSQHNITNLGEDLDHFWQCDASPAVVLDIYHTTQGRGTSALYRGALAGIGAMAETLATTELRNFLYALAGRDPSHIPAVMRDALIAAKPSGPFRLLEDQVRQAIKVGLGYDTLPKRRVPR